MSRAVLAMLLAASISLAPTEAAADPGVLRIGLPSVPINFDPASALDGSVPLIARQVFDTLVRYSDSGSDVEPALALSWTVSRDGLVWTFRLREGVRFHDGTRLTARVVADSLERLTRPGHTYAPTVNAVARLLRGAPGIVREVRAPDARTVQIALVLPYAPLLNVLAHPALSVVLAVPGAEGRAVLVGTGPFAVVEAAPGWLALEGRPGHWGGGPRLARIVFSDAPDQSQAMAALDSQTLDLYFPSGAPPRQTGASSVPGWRMGYLALQTEKEPFSRPKVRRAVATALGSASISLAVGASAVPMQAFLPAGVWGRRDGPIVSPVGAAHAKRLFAEAGLRKGAAPTFLVADGDTRPDMARVADAIRAALALADLPVTLRIDPAETGQPLMQNGEHALALLEAEAHAGDPHFLLYPLSASEGAVKGPSATNFAFYRNNRLDNLLIRASQLAFRPERQRLYVRAQAILAEELPWIPIYTRLHWVVARPEVRNLRLHPSGNPRLDRVTIDASLAPAAPGR